MKILYLYSELMGYQIPVLKEFVDHYKAEIHVIHWDHKKLTPYKPPLYPNIHYYNRSELSSKQLKDFVKGINPDIVYISGWMDKGYLYAVLPLRKKGIPVVSGFDDIWWKTTKQRVASILFPLVRNKLFSHAWVSGPYQYEYVKRLGFKNHEIIFNCYSADLDIFNSACARSAVIKNRNYPHRFLFVGRFEPVKGLDLLIQAWKNIREKRKDWELCVIGNGSLYQELVLHRDIKIMNFMQPEILVNEIEHAGCFILPSNFEPWALVLHEFAAAGLPIICSDVCGAAPLFVTPGYNGYIFRKRSVSSLEQKMLKIINATDDELLSMSANSHKAGQKITPEIAAASFMSVLA